MAGTTQWVGNFRDLSASLLRMATLADAGRIDMDAVAIEIARLQQRNQHLLANSSANTAQLDHPEWLNIKADIDPFDLVQLEYVIQICRSAHNLSDAGRALFEQSRKEKKMANDADRLRKYLAKFDLNFAQVKAW